MITYDSLSTNYRSMDDDEDEEDSELKGMMHMLEFSICVNNIN